MKKNRLLLVVLLFNILLVSVIYAKVDTVWVNRYNPTNDTNSAKAIVVDTTGNIYVTGSSKSPGLTQFDFATIKYNSDGVQQWAKRFNNPYEDDNDYAYAIAVDNAGNVYVTGTSYSATTAFDYLTVKYNALGSVKWFKTYNGPGNGNDEARAIAVDSKGNVYVTGYSLGTGAGASYDYATVKYDSLGNEQWVSRYNGPDNLDDRATGLVLYGDSVYVTGYSTSLTNAYDYLTLKINPGGDTAWTRRFGGSGQDYSNAIAIDKSGNIYVTGQYYQGSSSVSDIRTIRYSSSGSVTIYNSYDGPGPSGNRWDVASAIAVDSLGNAYATGYSMNANSNYDFVTIKYNTSGVIQSPVLRYDGGGNDRANAIVVNSLGYIYVTGYSNNTMTGDDYTTIKYWAANGQFMWMTKYNAANGPDRAMGIAVDHKGNTYVTGESYGGASSLLDYATIKYGVRRDAGVDSIVFPRGVIDSAGTVLPRALIRNNGSEMETFNTTFLINGTIPYSNTQSVISIPSDSTRLITFLPWNVGVRGNYTARCLTVFGSDTFTINDTMSRPFSVQVRDYAVKSVITPTLPVDSGVTISLKAWIYNLGTTNESDSAVMTIVNTSYRSAKLVTLLAGDSIELNFDNFDAYIPRGVYTVRCTTKLTGDAKWDNNLATNSFVIRVRDFSVNSITAPISTVDSNALITPKAIIYNNGTIAENDTVIFEIPAIGYSSKKCVNLGSGSSIEQSFNSFVADIPRGWYITRCSTRLAGDLNHNNDLKIDSFAITFFDVGVSQIIQPYNSIDSASTIIPRARVKNYGTRNEAFNVTLEIGPYTDTKPVSLLSGQDDVIDFEPWTVQARGTYAVKCYTQMADDMFAGNDTLLQTFSVVVKDYSVKAISPTTMRIDSGLTLTPKAWIYNYGSTDEADVPVLFTIIGTSYSSLRYVSLNSGDSIEQTFDNYLVDLIADVYTAKCSTLLNSDVVPNNNSAYGSIMVVVPGWHKLNNIYVTQKGIKDGGSMAVIGDTIFALQGGNTRNFFAYYVFADTWIVKCTIPLAPKVGGGFVNKKVKAGGALAVYNDVIYAFKGGGTNEFWQYQPGLDVWTKKADIPEYALSSSKRTKVKAGGALVAYEDSIYAFKGGNTNEFWVYDVNNDTWYQRKSLIAMDINNRLKKIKGGASLVLKDNKIYALVGGGTNLFYSYTPGQDSWIKLSDAFFGGYATIKKKVKDGASLVVVDNKIYALKGGNTTDFGCYDISANVWTTQNNIPTSFKVKAGGALSYTNNEIYAFIGGNSNEFWKYVFSSTPERLSKMDVPMQHIVNQDNIAIITSPISVSPNPASNIITINYSVPTSSKIALKLYNGVGQLIKTLVDEYHTSGSYTYQCRLQDPENKIASGIYFLKYSDENNQKEIKVVIK